MYESKGEAENIPNPCHNLISQIMFNDPKHSLFIDRNAKQDFFIYIYNEEKELKNNL